MPELRVLNDEEIREFQLAFYTEKHGEARAEHLMDCLGTEYSKGLSNAQHQFDLKGFVELINETPNPYYLKDFDGDFYNKYPEFAIFEEAKESLKQLVE